MANFNVDVVTKAVAANPVHAGIMSVYISNKKVPQTRGNTETFSGSGVSHVARDGMTDLSGVYNHYYRRFDDPTFYTP